VRTRADGVPRAGVTSVKFVTVPEALVKTIADGVPRAGVTRVGLLERTTLPVPVVVLVMADSTIAPATDAINFPLTKAVPLFVPPLAIGKTPVTPVVKGSPVALVRVSEVGVPRAGVTKVGLFDSTTLPVPVLVVVPVPPLATGTVDSQEVVPVPSVVSK
jgi:hypothetical protein